MVGAGVIVGVLAVWLASGRVQFTWRISWLAVIFALICAASIIAGGKTADWIAGGIFEVVHGIVAVIMAI